MWKKRLTLKSARKLSKKFCSDFKLPYCEIYYVDYIHECYGIYIWYEPLLHILLDESNDNRIGILVHELTHHLEHYGYSLTPALIHGYEYNLARSRVITWCKRNISNNPNWKLPLKAYINLKEMKNFKL